MGTMIKYGKYHKVTLVNEFRIGVEVINSTSPDETYMLFNIKKLRRGDYTIAKYLREWLEFEIIQARLS